MTDEQLAQLRKIFNLPEDASQEDVEAAMAKAEEAVDDAEADAAAKAAEAAAASEEGEEEEQIELPANPDPETFVYKADYDALASRLEQDASDAPTEAEIDDVIEKALASGRIAPATKAHHKATCSTRKGFDSFKAMVKIAPEIVSKSSDGKKAAKALAAKDKDKHGLTDSQLATARQMGVTPAAYAAINLPTAQ